MSFSNRGQITPRRGPKAREMRALAREMKDTSSSVHGAAAIIKFVHY